MLRATLATAALSALMLLTQPAAAIDLLIDGVPLPSDASAWWEVGSVIAA